MVLFVVACNPDTTGGVASSSRADGTPTTAPQSSAPPSPGTLSTQLNCGSQGLTTRSMAIYRLPITPPFIEILDVSNPLKPSLACTLSPAQGARFLSATRVIFWVGDALGTADLISGTVTRSARLPAVAGTGAFSADGTKFAYRAFDNAGGMSTHLYVAGSDRTLYVQEPIGGHGGPGPSFGPFDQLEFSPDGSLLLDFYTFRPASGPAPLMVFRSDGTTLFQSTAAPGGAWSPVGATLFFPVWDQPGVTNELDRLDATGQRQVVATALHGLFWLRMAPDGGSLIYNSSDSSVPDCGGLPHLWRLDLKTGSASQISQSISSNPVFVQGAVVWSNEQAIGPCGPGGPTVETGVILAHDLTTGSDAAVDTTLTVPGIGGPPLPVPSTINLLDVRFAPA
jgi:hypothetical protein